MTIPVPGVYSPSQGGKRQRSVAMVRWARIIGLMALTAALGGGLALLAHTYPMVAAWGVLGYIGLYILYHGAVSIVDGGKR